MQLFIDLMCRKIDLDYEKDVEHMGLNSLRWFIQDVPKNYIKNRIE